PTLPVGLVLVVVVTGTQLLQSLWSIRSWVATTRPTRSPLKPRPALGEDADVNGDMRKAEDWLSFSNSVEIQGASAA
ncbi:unnamed protein product, partial [Symbiodinium pilosum]